MMLLSVKIKEVLTKLQIFFVKDFEDTATSREEVYKAKFLVTLAFFYFILAFLTNLGGIHYVHLSQLWASAMGLLCTLSVPFIVKYVRKLGVVCLVFVGGNFLATCVSVFFSTDGTINFFTGIWFVVQYLTAYLVCGRNKARVYLLVLFAFILFVVGANLYFSEYVSVELPYTPEQELVGTPFILGIGLIFLHYLTSQFVKTEKCMATELSTALSERDLLVEELNKKQEELLEAKYQAETAASMKSDFLSTMSHEIRTPLNAVVGITHVLLENQPRLDQIENLNILKFSAVNLMALVNDILDFNKIEAGKIELEQAVIPVFQLLESIRHAHTLQARQKNIQLVFTIDDRIPRKLEGDPTRLAQILHNLLGNAIKFTNEGTVELKVEYRTNNENTVGLRFSVIDTGIGIPPDKLEQIFDSYTQANLDTTRRYGGTGLGLAITKRLIELHDSEIKVFSEESRGSTFSFDLMFPVIEIQNQQNDLPLSQTLDAENIQGKRILMVEDNAINVLIAKKHLAKLGVKLEVAQHGEEALAMVNAQSYDLVLMDLHMPVMDGFETTQKIRAWDTTLPIIGLTASVEEDIQDKMQQVGMNDWVFKPIEPEVLRDVIVRNLSETESI